ncbi:hypothetical protein C8250_011605 [Streptomyces sp. So13.3]|uniref:hypothetical protein n=1 Tax=Streptomyces sp. So13.3 TaxID=2136173 RepID=UPI001105C615|nr:hypothetical protein [Streptomyces sp. So13.3]QNA72475.1 hypothetical protein C8250_011605 [Streptomyces sp. So13.3]
MNHEWHLRFVRIPEGTHLSGSKDSLGIERDLLREDGTNKLLGPTESFPADVGALLRDHAYKTDCLRNADVRELSPTQQALADAIAEALEVVVREFVVPVFREVVAPAVMRKLSGITRSLLSAIIEARGQAGTTELAVPTATPPADSSKELDAAVEEPTLSMSSAEFWERLIAALVAEEFAAAQKVMISNARIEDGDLSPELKSAIKLVLEKNASLLDEEMLEFLSGARFAEGEYLLPGKEEALEGL